MSAVTSARETLLIKDILQKTTQFFRDRGIETARLDAELLLSHALKWDRMKIYTRYDYPLNELELEACRALIRRRTTGEPVAYILGERGFFHHTFKIDQNVLIPRPETELLVEHVLDWMKKSERERFSVVDLGTGSGCIAISIAAAEERANVLAIDISSEALGIAVSNFERIAQDEIALGKTNFAERVQFLRHDAGVLSSEQISLALGSLADVIVANPPYIADNDPRVESNVRKFEPSTALFSGEDGLMHIRQWAECAAKIANVGACVIFEIGSEQGDAVLQIFNSQRRFTDVRLIRDLSGLDRFVVCSVL